MFFGCKSCIQKDLMIKELKEQIDFLKGLIIPINVPLEASEDLTELDNALDPEDKMFDNVKETELEEVISERDRILSGQY